MDPVRPIFTALFDGKSVRFFKSPLSEPDFPWLPIAEIVALGVDDPDVAKEFITGFKREYGQFIREIVTNDGPVAVVPFAVAQRILEVMERDLEMPSWIVTAVKLSFVPAAMTDIDQRDLEGDGLTQHMLDAATRWAPESLPPLDA